MVRVGDVGEDVVDGVRHRLEAGGLSVRSWPRGFEVHPFGVRQRVWSDAARGTGRARDWRVHVRTGFVRGYSGSPAQLGALSLEMSLPALGGVVRSAEDPGRLEIASTMHVHAVNQVWATDFLARAARLQAAEAVLFARASALVSAGAEADVDEPGAGPLAAAAWPAGGTLLDVLQVGPTPDVPYWDAGELAECAVMLAVVPHARWAATERGLTGSVSTEAPWLGGGPSLLEMAGGVESPGLGLGLRVRLTVPCAGGVEDALVLNEREAAPGSRTDLLGGWSADEGVLQHSAFFPNALYARDIALHAALSSVLRAHWVRGWPPRARVSGPPGH
jgi:hypothetical protein